MKTSKNLLANGIIKWKKLEMANKSSVRSSAHLIYTFWLTDL